MSKKEIVSRMRLVCWPFGCRKEDLVIELVLLSRLKSCAYGVIIIDVRIVKETRLFKDKRSTEKENNVLSSWCHSENFGARSNNGKWSYMDERLCTRLAFMESCFDMRWLVCLVGGEGGGSLLPFLMLKRESALFQETRLLEGVDSLSSSWKPWKQLVCMSSVSWWSRAWGQPFIFQNDS